MSRGLPILSQFWGALVLAIILSLTLPDRSEGSPQSGCSPESIGVDTSKATTSGGLIWGKAWGETFVAKDTLIQSVTVWRIAPEHNDPSEMKFWITEVDSAGMPHTHLVVQEGPTISVVSPDSTRPTKIEFVFDPPISLPRPSVYCFWVQLACTGYVDLLIDAYDDYPGGYIWQTFRSDFDGCILRDYPRWIASADLVFEIVFCDPPTPTRKTTWGDLKVRYR
jgi:hypothetical protein